MSISAAVTSAIITSVAYVQPVLTVNFPLSAEISSVRYIEAVALLPVEEPKLSAVQYIDAGFRASYIDARVSAELTFPDVLSVDIVTPTDLVTLATTKSLSDSASFLDVLTREFSKPLADSVTETDALRYVFAKKLTDIQSLADVKSISFGKALADSTSTADLVALLNIRNFADSIDAPADQVAQVFHKALADSISFTDVLTAVKLFERSFADTLSVPDVPAYVFTPKDKEDYASVGDTSFVSYSKNTAENLYLIDNMDGNIEFALVKVIGELLLALDTQVIDFNTQKADNITTSSSGILAMQDYCDITYFLEDYVGTSRTFT